MSSIMSSVCTSEIHRSPARFFSASVRKLLFGSLFLFVALQTSTFAAVHYIRAGAAGTKDGSSWANAWPTLSSAKWTRGDTYYIAGGTYNENVVIAVAESGSLS